MIRVRKSTERGLTKTSWLTSYHSFAFGQYHDPEHNGFSWLRVINDDKVAPGGGFILATDHSFHMGIPPKNVDVFLEAARRWGSRKGA